MNGISKETFSSYNAEAQRVTLFEYVHGIWERLESMDANQKTAFSDQVQICKKRFVKRSHIIWISACALCFGLGAGWVTVEQVMAVIK